MRTYLVVIDESDEARLALRFAARRSAKTGGSLHILALIEPADFVAWGGVQATMEAEARQKAEDLVSAAAGTIFDELGLQPLITIKKGEGVEVVKEMLDEHPGNRGSGARRGGARRAWTAGDPFYRQSCGKSAMSCDGHSRVAG